jgi:dTDP-4-amino-4,6-dideoxygalactose transaminase
MNKRIFLSPPWMTGDEQLAVDEAFASNYIAPCGPMVERFEREFATVTGMSQACAVSSGTAALDLLFHELGVTRGDRVFCSDLTFVSSIAPAVHRGAEPVFIDCDAAAWAMDPNLLREALADGARAGRLPKAVVAVDLYGQCCDYDAIQAACDAYDVPLIIDAAEALGARYGKRHAGDAGWASVYSFNGNKIITTSGGGMLASHDRDVVERARKRSQQAREPMVWYEHEELGFNYRMSNIVAAIGVGQLRHLDEIVAKKRQIFEWYVDRLGGIKGVKFMPESVYGRCTRWLTVVELGENDDPSAFSLQPSALVKRVIDALERENIESRPVWKPMHVQPVFHGARVFGGDVSERLFNNGVCLPSGAGLCENEVLWVCEIVRRSLAQSEL